MGDTPSGTGHQPPVWAKGWFLDLVACLLLVALVLLFYWKLVTPKLADRGSFPPGDFTIQFYSLVRAQAQQVQQGLLPLWNPNANSGHPLLADPQSAVFYPLSLLTVLSVAFLGGTAFALELEAIVHFCLAALFTYALARRLLPSRSPAFLAACVFTFGGYLTGYPPLQITILRASVWLPLVLLGLEVGASRIEGSRTNASIAFMGAGLALGLAYLAGSPQISIYIGYASAAYLVFRLWTLSLRRQIPAALAIFLVAAAGLSAAQWLPSVQYVRLSSRTGLAYADLNNGYQLIDILQLVLPSQSALYVGILPLLLASLALARSRSRTVWFWAGTGAASLLLAFGDNLFVYPVFYLLAPGFNLFRSQERIALLFSFSLAMLAGSGLADWQELPDSRRLSRVLAFMALGALGLIVMAYGGWLAEGQAIPSPFWWFLQQGALLFLLLGAGAGLVWWQSHGGSRSALAAILLVLVLLDLFTVNSGRHLVQRQPDEYDQPSPLIELMKADAGVFRVSDEGQLVGSFGSQFGLEETGSASPLRLERYRRLLEEVPKEFAWRLLNVKYVTTADTALKVPSDVVASETHDSEVAYLHSLADPAPRAWVVHQVEVVPDDDAVVARLSDWRFDPFQAAILESPLQSPLAVEAGSGPSTVRWVHVEPALIELDVNLPSDGLLVLSEIHYPGWRTWVDGRPAPTLRADLTLRAIPIPAGSHSVKMAYRPWTVLAGAVLSLLSLAIALAVAVWSARRNR